MGTNFAFITQVYGPTLPLNNLGWLRVMGKGNWKGKGGRMRKLYRDKKKEEDEGFNSGELSFPYRIISDRKWL